jgi:hypothetical protein
VNYLHVSKELVVVPRMALGTDGKPTPAEGQFDYVVDREGHTYRRPTPKARAKGRNSWGAFWYIRLRERQQRGAEQRKEAAAWAALQKQTEATDGI